MLAADDLPETHPAAVDEGIDVEEQALGAALRREKHSSPLAPAKSAYNGAQVSGQRTTWATIIGKSLIR